MPSRSSVLGTLVERTLYQDRLAADNGRAFEPTGWKRATTRMHQALFERGIAPPWVWSAERCRSFWATQDDELDTNNPTTYSTKSREVVHWLRDFWEPDVGVAESVLEIGCNAGANLEGLRECGYSRLAGVEINPAAIAEMRSVFPQLAATAEIHQGPMETVLPGLPSDSYDTVFTMAVLIHVHPTSRDIFAEMVRVARKHVVVVEAERATCAYVFARNYRRVFERLGARHVRDTALEGDAFPAASTEGYVGYTARLFRVGD